MGDKIKYFLLPALVMVFIVLWINGCLIIDKHQYLENSKKIKVGMGINQVIKIMGGSPYFIYDYSDGLVDSLGIEFDYYDKKTEAEIFITFNDSLKVIMVGLDS